MCLFEGQKMPKNCFESFNIEENLLTPKQWALEDGSSSVNDLYAELAFPVKHRSNSLYLKQCTALLGYKSYDIFCFF